MQRAAIRVVVAGLTVMLGCDGDIGINPDDADVGFRLVAANGEALNSAALNGIQLNGIQLNGIQLNGIQLNGIQLNGIQLNGSTFSGTLATANGPVAVSGPDLEGAELLLTAAGASYTLRFDDIYKDPARPDGDVYFYQVGVRDDAAGTWTSLCHDSSGTPTAAIPIANYWNYTTGARIDDPSVVTFACRGAVLAKCVEWGYAPWHTGVRCNAGNQGCATVSLKEHHQACTRMARADYCGDGRSYTFDSTPIDLYDWLQTKIQTRSTISDPDWAAEAEWGPNGATCVGDELRLQMFDDLGISYTFPTCLDAIDDLPQCGTVPGNRSSSLLANAYCKEWMSDPAKCSDIAGSGVVHGPKN